MGLIGSPLGMIMILCGDITDTPPTPLTRGFSYCVITVNYGIFLTYSSGLYSFERISTIQKTLMGSYLALTLTGGGGTGLAVAGKAIGIPSTMIGALGALTGYTMTR